ncbi:pantothenate kinase [Lottiidibacillus patelloidae]|uniref:Pantothenate kinase n=1 Tax=Lottiidibacillus patelloidae TaxID=2670334 RepID=A0A263BW77_9BACI|nr:M3 family oligoendopeptidase [Lottiidibacillus patelloidae]OZM57577.1 pantothenate kinase [Lottiidibacillus patelloidae]
MEKTTYPSKWNLDSIFTGGSDSSTLHLHLTLIKKDLNLLNDKIHNLLSPRTKENTYHLNDVIQYINKLRLHITEAKSYITCLHAQDVKDNKASLLKGEISTLSSQFLSTIQEFQNVIGTFEKDHWRNMLDSDELREYRFVLNEWRENTGIQLNEEVERIITSLMDDGYHAWGQMYNLLVGSIRVKFTLNGVEEEYTVGQALNFRSHPDETVRQESHDALLKGWQDTEDVIGETLNNIVGFRLQVDKKRGRTNELQEPLKANRMKQETLNVMWNVVEKNKQPFTDYLDHKASLLGKGKMQAYDFWAPTNKSTQKISYQEGIDFILKHFGKFGRELESFARQAFMNGWVEAENRPNKSPVAFCASFPLSGQSRVIMTYGETITNILTLTHELGHAFHNYAMKTVDGINKQYPLCFAETASFFTELIILNASLETAESSEEKLFLLDEKLKRSVMNFMNIHSRYLFERKIYKEREKGLVSSARMNALMDEALMEGYAGSIEGIPENLWASIPHFYLTSSPFYNFPYTFGYLFSICIYATAKEEGKDFEKKYLSLLRDTGKISVEDLVMKHLGEDITQEAFWEKGMKLCVKDVEEFIRLSKNLK